MPIAYNVLPIHCAHRALVYIVHIVCKLYDVHVWYPACTMYSARIVHIVTIAYSVSVVRNTYNANGRWTEGWGGGGGGKRESHKGKGKG